MPSQKSRCSQESHEAGHFRGVLLDRGQRALGPSVEFVLPEISRTVRGSFDDVGEANAEFREFRIVFRTESLRYEARIR